MNELMVKMENVSKVYSSSSGDVIALNNINLDVHVGELVAIVGKSGSGKTTLLNIISGLDQPTAGTITLDGVNLSEITNQEALSIRRNKIGMVFQTFGLLSLLSAYENVELQLRIAGIKYPERDSYTKDALEQVGLGSRITHRPDELSGGEQQRVSIARAIAKKPKILFVDEPTSHLDSRNTRIICDLFRKLSRQDNITLVMVTHDQPLIDIADSTKILKDGILS